MICVRNIDQFYGRQQALSGVSFTAEDGKVTVLLGSVNSGKSAICDLVCGVTAADEGSVTIDGCAMSPDAIEARRHIGYMPQNPAVYRDMTARGQLRFIGQAHEMSMRAMNERIEKIIRDTKLSDVADQPIRSLPQAYLQRVCLAQALMGEVCNIVLDSPARALDARQTFEFRSILQEAVSGKTVLITTDNLTEAEQLADTVYVLEAGRIVAKCAPHELAEARLDSDATVLLVDADAQAVAEALKSVKVLTCAEEDGLTRAVVQTGFGKEGRKALFSACASASLPVVQMRPMERTMEEVVASLKNEPFRAESSQSEGAEEQ